MPRLNLPWKRIPHYRPKIKFLSCGNSGENVAQQAAEATSRNSIPESVASARRKRRRHCRRRSAVRVSTRPSKQRAQDSMKPEDLCHWLHSSRQRDSPYRGSLPAPDVPNVPSSGNNQTDKPGEVHTGNKRAEAGQRVNQPVWSNGSSRIRL